MTTIYDTYLNKNVFLLTKTEFFYNGIVVSIDDVERKLLIDDRKLGNVVIDFSIIQKVELRGENFG